MLFLNVDKILCHQKDIRKNMIKQIKEIDREGIHVSLVLPNLLMFLEIEQGKCTPQKVIFLFHQVNLDSLL